VLRDAVCADVFIRTCGASAGRAESKFAGVFAIIFIGCGKRGETSTAPAGDGNLAIQAVGFSVVPDVPVRTG
jgi:hypothetical protein